jgi:hypothetical protein
MDERLKFIARVLDGEKMAPLCRAGAKSGCAMLEGADDAEQDDGSPPSSHTLAVSLWNPVIDRQVQARSGSHAVIALMLKIMRP